MTVAHQLSFIDQVKQVLGEQDTEKRIEMVAQLTARISTMDRSQVIEAQQALDSWAEEHHTDLNITVYVPLRNRLNRQLEELDGAQS